MSVRNLWKAFSGLALAAYAGALTSCGGAPTPAAEGASPSEAPQVGRRKNLVDDCAQVPGEPPPEPLARVYEGLARKARCQREVYSIMGGVTHFLGVQCEYCHVKDDYPAPTHRKSVANWMASELIPSLQKEGGGDVWCNDCHAGKAKILGDPRQQAWAIEWMTTHLTDDFERKSDGGALRCKDCHGENLGSPGFRRQIILTDHLPPRPERKAAPASEAQPETEPAPPSSVK